MSYKAMRAKLMERAVGPVEERMVEYVLRHFNEVTFMSSEKLCYTLGCSAAELQAFCSGFGTGNLMELMALLREVVYSQSNEGNETADRTLRDIADTMVRYEMSNITDFTADLDTELIDRLAREMKSASEVYIVGVRSSAPMGVYAAHILSAVGVKTRKIDVAENYVDGVVNMDRSGLVLALDFTRYHKGTLVLLNILRKNGFHIAAITDSPEAPVARVANYSICVPRRSYDYTDSFVTTTMLLNMLATYIGMQDKSELVSRLRQYDEITQGLEFFF